MAAAAAIIQRASRDYWRRFLTRAVAPQSVRDARRVVKRYPLAMAGRIFYAEGDHMKREEFAIIEISPTGVTGLCREEIPWHAEVCIEVNPEGTPFALQGLARHCTSTVGGYKVGVELVFDDEAGGKHTQKPPQSGGLEPEA